MLKKVELKNTFGKNLSVNFPLKYFENEDFTTKFLDIFKIDGSEVIHKNVHGWLYAFSENQSSEAFWDDKKCIGITGDWFTGGRAENAWINAKLLSEKINN